MSDNDICRLAYELEVSFNPYCGYQDPYGCGVGGFKRIEFMDSNTIKYEFLPVDLFDSYDLHLVFTGVTRNSKTILKDVSKNIDKISPLISTVHRAYDFIKDGETLKFMEELNLSWEQKKETSKTITENLKIRQIDKDLQENPSVISHKLCGAGNGGFFLTFSKRDSLTVSYDSVKITVSPEGVKGESI
tara:strand:- start:510 stop:1076 length:567 start_codon:yes stop_codon:yes gene_type:complete